LSVNVEKGNGRRGNTKFLLFVKEVYEKEENIFV